MVVKVSKPEINIREKISELDYGHVPYHKMPAGSVIQVIQGTSTTSVNVNNTNLTDSPGTVTIYPKSSTSKMLVQYNAGGIARGQVDSMGLRLMRNDTEILGRRRYAYQSAPSGNSNIHPCPITVNLLDEPNTAEPITYKVQVQIETSNGTAGWQINTSAAAPTSIGTPAVATMVVMEIAG